jgi:hypothetical protein
MDQHNDHCIVNIYGDLWCIIGARPGLFEVLRRIDGNTIETAYIDTTKVDWDAYCKEAVKLLYQRWG